MSIKKVEIENFTAFDDVSVDFSKGVNVILGENGTGKTHLLKLNYVLSSYTNPNNNDANAFQKYFMIEHKNLLKDNSKSFANIHIEYKKKNINYTLNKNGLLVNNYRKSDVENNSNVFIPAKDMLSHSKGLLEMAKKYSNEMPFDKSLLDIIEKAKQWKVDVVPELGKNIMPKLENMIDGTIIVENDTFFVKKHNGTKVEFSVEAEGIKKIGLLWQLIMNESITKDSILFWDEPEANINPKLLKDVAAILLELSKNGVQIFVATHNYVFAKYIEVLMNDTDKVTFHSLYKTENNGVKCESNRNFRELKHNSIISSLDVLIEQVFDLDLGD